MSLAFERIERDFRRLRDFVLNDLSAMTAHEVGGNYAAAALITCAYDAIANLRDGASNAGEQPFRDTLQPPWQPVAKSLYDALRNGIVHGYETQTIRVAGRQIKLAIAWSRGRHLTLDGLILAVPDLADGLRGAFDAFESRLRADPALRDRFYQRYQRDRVHEVRSPSEQDAWRRILSDP